MSRFLGTTMKQFGEPAGRCTDVGSPILSNSRGFHPILSVVATRPS